MKVFYGAAIQGRGDRRERTNLNRELIDAIKACGHEVVTEHTAAETYDEAMAMLSEAFGKLPRGRDERTVFNRVKITEALAGDIGAAVFDVTVPSLGTGIEMAHAYLRLKLGLKPVPVLLLYDPSYGRELSGMIRGISKDELPNVMLRNYGTAEEAKAVIKSFFDELKA
jgi:hypothetical protein